MSVYGWGLIYSMTVILIIRGDRETQREDLVKIHGWSSTSHGERPSEEPNPADAFTLDF